MTLHLAVAAHGADAITRIILRKVKIFAVRAILTLQLAVVDPSSLTAAIRRLRSAHGNRLGGVFLVALSIARDTFFLRHLALTIFNTRAVARAGVATTILSRNSQHN